MHYSAPISERFYSSTSMAGVGASVAGEATCTPSSPGQALQRELAAALVTMQTCALPAPSAAQEAEPAVEVAPGAQAATTREDGTAANGSGFGHPPPAFDPSQILGKRSASEGLAAAGDAPPAVGEASSSSTNGPNRRRARTQAQGKHGWSQDEDMKIVQYVAPIAR